MHRLTAVAIISSAVVLVLFVTTFSTRTPLATAQSCVPVPSGIVSWWRGEGDASDHIGVNNGQDQGAVTYAPGVVGEAFHFDGSDHSWVRVPDHVTLNLTSGATLEFWYKSDLDGQTAGLVAKRAINETTNYGVNDVPWGLGLYYNDPAYTGFGDDHNIFEAVRVPSPGAGHFHHFAGTYEQLAPAMLRLTIYVDGAFVKSLDLPGNLFNSVSDTPVTIGTTAERGERFFGDIDEVTIYDRALTATEVGAVYGAGQAGKCRGTVTATPTSTPTATATSTAANRLLVTPFKQGIAPYDKTPSPDDTPPWEDVRYDHSDKSVLGCGTTIAQCGCALTSAAMVLNFYGVSRGPDGKPTNPETLNEFLRGSHCVPEPNCIFTSGYIAGGVNWDALPIYSRLAKTPYPSQPVVTREPGLPAFEPTRVANDLATGRPVIVELKQMPASGTPIPHFVVINGTVEDSFRIIDPLTNDDVLDGTRTPPITPVSLRRLSIAPTPTAQSSALQVDAQQEREGDAEPGDSGLLLFAAVAPAQILVTDPVGRRTGYDSTMASTVLDIPGSTYDFEPELGDSTGELPAPPSGAGVHLVRIDAPVTGSYHISVVGAPGVPYAIATYGYDEADALSLYGFEGRTSAVGPSTYSLHYDPKAGGQTLTQALSIDVKPGSESNPINLRSTGVVPVAVLGDKTLDVTNIAHVRFGPAGATPVRTGGLEDVNNDGYLDRVYHFAAKDTGLTATSTEACLAVVLPGGLPGNGCDVVRIVP